jgi:iron complex transport system ATP-binding protein
VAVILSCRNLCFSFEKEPVLDRISFDVEKGRVYTVLGRNGSGKTTLIQCLDRILIPSSGGIYLDGTDLKCFSINEIARNISLVPQEHLDIFPYRVLDVVVMGRAPYLKSTATPGKEEYKAAGSALGALNAGTLAEKNFNRISGGERQIVMLARALAQSTRIMLLDEPTNHLDFKNQYHLLSTIKKLCRSKGISIVASMHDPNLASFFADWVIMIKNGRIMVQGEAQTVMTRENICTLYETKTTSVVMHNDRQIFFPEPADP